MKMRRRRMIKAWAGRAIRQFTVTAILGGTSGGASYLFGQIKIGDVFTISGVYKKRKQGRWE